jgi:DNA end-binding protein Ku
MARALWHGNIAFGLVTIPVGLHTAVREERVQLHMLTPDGKCRIRRKLVCQDTGKEYEFGETVRGFEVAPDQYVVITQDELQALEPEDGREIEIVQFVDAAEVDPIYFNRPYYLLPEKGAERPYSLLVRALTRSGKIGVAQFTMRDRDYVGTLRVKEDRIILETMYYHDELVEPAALPIAKQSRVPEKEEKLALTLIETLSGNFTPEKFHNEYNDRVSKLLEQKKKGKPIPKAAKTKKAGKVVDLAEALAASLKNRGSKDSHGDEAPKRKAKVKKLSSAKSKSSRSKRTDRHSRRA